MTERLRWLLPRSFKALLKRSRFLFNANARLRARQLRRRIQRLRHDFDALARSRGITYSRDAAVAQARGRLAARSIHPTVRRPGELRIFWVGTNLQQDRSGFLQTLESFGTVTSFVNAQGEYGFRSVSPRNPEQLYDAAVVEENSRLLLDQVRAELARNRIDVLIGQMWSNFLAPEALREIQKLGVPVMNIAMDDRLPEHWLTVDGRELGSVGLRSSVDLVLTTTRECCAWYAVRDCPAIYWPLASDSRHFSGDPAGVRDLDVVFVGSRYGVRDRIVTALEQADIRVHAFGPGWPLGSVSADECARLFARAKIVLGVGTVGYTDDVYTIKLRDFDAPMSGALYATHRNPDLLELFDEGREIACYVTPEECVTVVRRYLADDAGRIRVAAAGTARARRDHSWERRLAEAFSAIGLIGES